MSRKEIGQIIDWLRARGLEVTVSSPDPRHWHVHVWMSRPPYREVHFRGSLTQATDFLKAIVFGMEARER